MLDVVPDAPDAGPGIDELVVGDPPAAWRDAGFTVDDDGVCRSARVRIRLVGRDDGKRIGSWACGTSRFPPDADVDGLATQRRRRRARAMRTGRPRQRRPTDRSPGRGDAGHGAHGESARGGRPRRPPGPRHRCGDVRRTDAPDLLPARGSDPRGDRPGRTGGERTGPVLRPGVHGQGPRRAARAVRRPTRTHQTGRPAGPAHRHASPSRPRPVGSDRLHG